MIDATKYQHIIWDWNGTLLNDAWLFVDIMNGILKQHNLGIITIKKYRDIFGFPIQEYYKKLGFKLENKSFEKYGAEFINAYETRKYEAKLYPMVKILLSKLSSKNIYHSILSASQQNLLNDLTNFYRVQKYFSYINGVNNFHANGKVDKGLEFIKKINLHSSEVILIGDTDHDFEVAQAMGIDCLLISHGHYSYSRLIKTGAFVIKKIEDIFDIFSIKINCENHTN